MRDATPICYAFSASILGTGEPVGTYHIPASVPTEKRRGKAYHLAFLDLRDTRFPDASGHGDVPNLSVTRDPDSDDYR